MSKNLRWDSHKNHWELLKDALLDAIDCMEYTMTEKGEKYKEDRFAQNNHRCHR